ncbi:hypothetical protein T12_9838 [Trichinella patagoniensis]|uniref:Secreted protein n=1 Tax=Trichinella patagoniensis TaxID=990121 RepID=A0A0V0Z5M1_9BILA|nr:hypothetical protein T12_9838 [Trichinella patagoniensis]
MAGVTPVLLFTLLLYASMAKESISSHCCRFSSHVMDSMSRSVRLNLSACPFPCGWYGEDRVFLMSKRRHNSRTTCASNERPWSLCKQSGAAPVLAWPLLRPEVHDDDGKSGLLGQSRSALPAKSCSSLGYIHEDTGSTKTHWSPTEATTVSPGLLAELPAVDP